MIDDNLTDITVILDSSGSMHQLVYDTIGGFNRFLHDQKEMPGKAIMSLAANIDEKLAAARIGVKSANAFKYTASAAGTNKLYDAVSTGTRLYCSGVKDFSISMDPSSKDAK